MTNILLTVAGTVVVLNIIYLFVPDGKYEKYIRVTAGLIVILTFLNLMTGIEISGDVLHFDEAEAEYDLSQLEEVMAEQTENAVADKITSHLLEKYGGKFEVKSITIADNAVDKVTVEIYDSPAGNEIVREIAAYCDINTENVVVE